MTRIKRHRLGWLAILLLPILLPYLGCDGSSVADRYERLYVRAVEQIEGGNCRKALRLADRMKAIAPESTGAHWIVAAAQAGLGDHDAAFAALVLLEPEMIDTSYARGEETLEPLRDDPRFEEFLERSEVHVKAWSERMHTLHGHVEPQDADPHESVDEILATFEARRERLSKERLLLPVKRGVTLRGASLDAKIATLERHLGEHGVSPEGERAALELVRTSVEYKKYYPAWGGDSDLVIRNADRFLDLFADSEHAAEVHLTRAIATWKAYWKDDENATRPVRAAGAVRLLEELRREFPESAEHDRALVWKLLIEYAVADRRIDPELTSTHETLQIEFKDNEELEEYAWDNAYEAMFQFEFSRSFDAEDLQGRRWNAEAIRGNVILIEFWATWCGPCISELPLLRELHEKYRDREFEIVGVSLDHLPREEFEDHCRELGISWPQIYDGQGWDAELAQRFHTSAAPTYVLIDREGRVVASGRELRGIHLVDRVAESIESS